MDIRKNLLTIILAITIIFITSGWLFYEYKVSSYTKCDFLNLTIKGKCVCPEGHRIFKAGLGDYCATDSQKSCESSKDCPENERCISTTGTSWFCSGRLTGCYRWWPESPEDRVCME